MQYYCHSFVHFWIQIRCNGGILLFVALSFHQYPLDTWRWMQWFIYVITAKILLCFFQTNFLLCFYSFPMILWCNREIVEIHVCTENDLCPYVLPGVCLLSLCEGLAETCHEPIEQNCAGTFWANLLREKQEISSISMFSDASWNLEPKMLSPLYLLDMHIKVVKLIVVQLLKLPHSCINQLYLHFKEQL